MTGERLLEPDVCRRAAALASLSLSLLLSILLLHEIPMVCIIGNLAAACGTLTSLPSSLPVKGPSRRFVLAQGLTSLLPVVLSVWTGKDALPAFYTLVVAIPALGSQTAFVVHAAADREFLSGELSAWDMTQLFARQVFSAYPVAMMALAWSVADGDGPVVRAVLWYAAVSLSVHLVVGFLRSLTAWTFSPDLFRTESGEPWFGGPGFLRPMALSRLDVGQRMLFEKIARYMDESKPYLDDAYSLDDMARALLTNKSYISRVINACTGLNVPQFVNYYRVRYSMDLYRRDPKLKVAELALMSGFHSGVTYNLAFKLFVGQPPSEWCRRSRDRPDGKPSREPRTDGLVSSP